MADQLQLRGGTTNEHSTFTGALREVTVDTDKDTLIVHDAATAGGHPLLREDGSNSALSLGTAGTPSIKFTGDTNTGIYSPGADQVAISTGGAGRLFVAANGKISIGEATTAGLLHLGGATPIISANKNGSGTDNVFLYDNSVATNDLYVGKDSSNLIFRTAATERLRIDSSGRLLVGATSAPAGSLSQYAKFGVIGNTLSSAGSAVLALGRGENTSTPMAQDDLLAQVLFTDNSAGQYASINSYVDAAPASGDYPGRLVFSTTADGASSPTERMRIDSSGNVGIGTTTTNWSLLDGLIVQTVNGSAGVNIASANSTDNAYLAFGYGTAHADQFSAYVGRVGDDTLVLGTANTQRLRIDSSGRVGIGTTSPSTALHLANYDPVIRLEDLSSGSSNIYAEIDANSASGNLFLDADPGNNGASTIIGFRVDGTERARIDSSGRVGIGTSSPTQLLELESGTGARIAFTDTGTRRWSIGTPEGGSTSFSIYDESGSAEALRITSAGNVGIGTTSPSELVTVNGNIFATSGGATRTITLGPAGAGLEYNVDGTTYLGGRTDAYPLVLRTNSNERLRIDSSGRLLVGTTTSGHSSMGMVMQGSAGIASASANLLLAKNTASVSDGSSLGTIYFSDNSHDLAGYIDCARDGGAWTSTSSQPTRLAFGTTSDGSSTITERARITNRGFFKASNTGSYQGTTGTYHEFRTDLDDQCLYLHGTNASWNNHLILGRATRAATSAYKFILFQSGNGTDTEYNLQGDGNAYADGSWNGGGADYAEYFEWSDGNTGAEDRRGISVVLDGNKIREAVAGEDPIGVISGNPSMVGDAAWNKWSGKHLRDEFGSYLLDAEGYRQLNPDYDPDQEYISREQRPEWDCVGLMGKLRIRKGQVTGARWIKMRDVSDNVEEWLVR